MCRVRTLELGDDTRAVAAARRATVELLQLWDLTDLRADAELLVSELVTNAVLYGRSGVALTVAVADGVLEVGVSDRSPLLPAPRIGVNVHAPWRAEGGRGLRMVEQIADEWGVAALADGKQVWFRLSVDEQWPHRTDCPCGGDDLEQVRLESGRVAVTNGPWDGAWQLP
jgi:anti-sigma regulatory factor (Ser/Thr protein kinase)